MPNARHRIRALVVDYGEVLSHPADPVALAEMARAAGAEPELFADAYWRHRESYDRGEVDGPAYWRLVGDAVGARVDDDLVARLIESDIALWTRLDEPMVDWVREIVDRGVPVGLLSNMVLEIGAHLRDELLLFEGFASVTYSYEVRLAKPDPGIYRRALESLGAAPEEALFVDDRVANVKAARALGMHAHHFGGRDRLVADVAAHYELVPSRL